jgi:hypothetical protein
MASTITKWCHPGDDQYSIDLLEQLDPYQKTLLKVAERNKNKKGKDIPSQIIINHFNKTYPHPQWLQGPWKVEYMVGSTPNGMIKVYNLYDSHLHPEKCGKGTMRANEWIIRVLKSADVFVDVFLETAPPLKTFFGSEYEEMELGFRPGALFDLITELGSCVRQKKDCPAPNSRIHGVDIRQVGRVLRNQIMEAYPDPETSEISPDESVQNLIEMSVNIFASTKMQKEIKDLPKCMYNKLIGKFIGNLKNCLLDINKPMSYKKRVTSLLMCIGGILMDIYLMGRLFKIFNTTKERGQPDRVQNAIIYTGTEHSAVYRDVLESCGFNVVFENKSSGPKDQCVDISNLPFPLFRG